MYKQLFFTSWTITAVLGVKIPEELYIGVLISNGGPYTGLRYEGAVALAIDDVNNDPNILNGTTLDFDWRDSMCDASEAAAAAVDMYNDGVNVIIGPACSESCIAVAYISTGKELPMISYGCSSAKLSDSAYFSRTKDFAVTSKTWTSQLYIKLLNKFNWKHVCIVDKADEVFGPLGTELKKALKPTDITIEYTGVYFPQDDFDDKIKIWDDMVDKCRVILFLTTSRDVQDFMAIAYKMGLLDEPGFAFLSIDQRHPSNQEKLKELNNYLGTDWTRKEMNRILLDGILSVTVERAHRGEDEHIANFSKEVIERAKQFPFDEEDIDENTRADLSLATYLYDATVLYAHTIDRILKNATHLGVNSIKDVHAGLFMKELVKVKFKGISKTVEIDRKGDRIPYYEVVNIKDGRFKMILEGTNIQKIDQNSWMADPEYRFPGNSSEIPPDLPKCGFFNEECRDMDDKERENLIIMCTVGPVVLMTVVTALVFFYRPKLFGSMACSK